MKSVAMKPFLALCLMVLLSGCAAGRGEADAASNVREAWSGSHCPTDGPAEQRLSAGQWQQSVWSQQFESQTLSTEPKQDLLILRAGSKPTAGYRLSVNSQSKLDDVLLLEVAVNGPPAGTMMAQVMTSPCLALWVPQDLELTVRWLAGSKPADKAAQEPTKTHNKRVY